ncbi:MAG TPA: PQQ-binding-like beta-propeller repeat protein [Sphingomonadaceae bacterium]
MNHRLVAASGLRRIARGRAFRIATASLAASLAMLGAASGVSAKPGDSFDFKTWDSNLGGGDSSQYSSLDQINKANVDQLQVAWTFPTGAGPAPHFNPVVMHDVMYFLTPKADLVALNAATGEKLWDKQFQGRVGGRGMNYWESADGKDKRLLFMMNGNLTEVSADNGELISSFGNGGQVDLRVGLHRDVSKINPLQTDNPGRIYKNIIIMSLPAGAYDFAAPPADIHAYDILTGKLLWVFHTVPEKGEFGYDTWPAKDHELVGGVHNWNESTIDTETGIMYIPLGTARYDFYGGNRKGNDLFANSLVALDAKTGKRIWHYQIVHHDLWDFDLPQAPKLLTIHKDGKDVPVVIQATKFGYLYVFDRRTGKPIWPIVETKVPASDVPGEQASPTQPIPSWPKPFARQGVFHESDIDPYISQADQDALKELLKTARNEGLFTPPSLVGTISWPGHNGGANWNTSSVDPARHRFFIVAKTLPTFDKLVLDTRPEAQAAMPNGGGDVKPYKSNVDFMLQKSNGLPGVNPPWSLLTAYDMDTGKIMWQIPDGDVTALKGQGGPGWKGSVAPRGGPVATGGDLLFVGTSSDRMFRAYDQDTGKVLWEHQLDAATEGTPAVYEVGGKEYVVIAVGGDGLFAPKLGQTAPGENRYVAFALPGKGGQ